ncbi:MAG: ribonuclease III [Candidatus Harrisonbacteria bacterium]|nr:ribonuclease III [Candidatus Harrisonbacteria bacterium]MBI2405980.1 ribonuclease III [Candidatus Harrisonbacteria bacterium]
MPMDTSVLEKTLNYVFRKPAFLAEALTHRSYLNEHAGEATSHNERLEFLGDAVLELAVTEDLFGRFPQYEEGTLTSLRAALVNYVMLAAIARALDVEKFLRLSRGEAKDTGRAREVILANAMEAIIGAIYMDGGYASARGFVLRAVMPRLDEVFQKSLYKDAKSLLQEKIQADRKLTPTYRVLEERGPDHARVFDVGVYFGDELIAKGSGKSKQDGEVEAARNALDMLHIS